MMILNKRIEVIDALRGFALLGIFLVHVLTISIRERDTPLNLIDTGLKVVYLLFLSGKFYTIFSFLFGMGFAIKLESAKQKGVAFTGKFLWRLVILYAIGYLHNMIYGGDILQLYAFLGLFLIALRNLSTRKLLIIVLVLLIIFPFSTLYGLSIKPYLLSDNAWNRLGDLAYELSYNFVHGKIIIMSILFILGLCAGREGIFTGNHFLFSKRTLLFTIVISTLSTLITAYIILNRPRNGSAVGGFSILEIISVITSPIQTFSISFLYIWLMVKAYRGALMAYLRIFVPIGKMGLTIYIMQSVILLLVKSILTEYTVVTVFGIAIFLFFLQILFARLWFNNFKSGPIEWVWRTMTQLMPQQLRTGDIVDNQR